MLVELAPPVLDGLAFTRLLRQDPRFVLLPIICLAARDSVADRIEAIKAGADHYLAEPVEASLLTHLVISRAERGRRLREMVHRDGLTGLLNHATLMAELEHTLEYARRHGETFGFIMVDVDHFKRINDQHGHLIGDQVLLHLSRIFHQTVRASDVIGRYGGEEFGVVLRRTDRAGVGRADPEAAPGAGRRARAHRRRPRAAGSGLDGGGLLPGRRPDRGGTGPAGRPGALPRQARRAGPGRVRPGQSRPDLTRAAS